MLNLKQTKRIQLDNQTLFVLKMQAEKDGRKLKNFIEDLLKEQAEKSKLTPEYKILMDEMLEKHERGEVGYMDWDDFKKTVI